MPGPEQAAVPAGERIDVGALGLGALLVGGCGRIPAVEPRDGDQVADAVAVQVGHLEEMLHGIVGRGLGAHRAHPAGLAGGAVEQLQAPEGGLRRDRAGLGDDDLGPPVAVEVEYPGPGLRLASGVLTHVRLAHHRCPERPARRDRDSRERLVLWACTRPQRDDLGLAVAVEVGVLEGPDRLEAQVDRAGPGPPGRRVQADPSRAVEDRHHGRPTAAR